MVGARESKGRGKRERVGGQKERAVGVKGGCGVWVVGKHLPGPLDNFQESRKTKVSTMREGASKELTLGWKDLY